MNVEHHIASRLATTKEAEALIADDLRRALEQAFREGQLAAPSATNPYAPPKPKPAWHDAVAVIATFRDECGMVTGVWVPEGQPGYWEGPEGDVVASDLLEDVTPMIEARVTDETLARVEAAFTDDHDSFDARIRAVTAAALGLDPEPAGRSTAPHLHYDAKENA